jgi:hypothetical protein
VQLLIFRAYNPAKQGEKISGLIQAHKLIASITLYGAIEFAPATA